MIINTEEKLQSIENHLEKSKSLLKNPCLEWMEHTQLYSKCRITHLSLNDACGPVGRDGNIFNY